MLLEDFFNNDFVFLFLFKIELRACIAISICL